MHNIIAALILPVPLFHLWLHANLGFWRQRPWLIYFIFALVWAGLIFLIPFFANISPLLFVPSISLGWIGNGLMILGLLFVVSSAFTLGGKRFFVWAVLKPKSVQAIRITKGPFSFIPHPAYTGYILVALGNLLATGELYMAGILFYTLNVMPLVIWLEEWELKERITSS